MKPSRKLRHWLPLPFALVWIALAVTDVADLSGQPVPKWRKVASTLLPPVTFGLLAVNIFLDRGERGRQP